MPAKPKASLPETLSVQMELMMQRLVMPRVPALDDSLDISPADRHSLAILGRSGPIPMTTLAQMLGLPLSTTTHRVDKLVKKKLLTRGRSESDRRIVVISLAPSGQALEEKLRALHLAIAAEMLKPLTSAERKLFVELLTKINKD